MPKTAPLSESYLDAAVEKARECLRDLRVVVDQQSAHEVRERCKERLAKFATVFGELRTESEGLQEEIERLVEKVHEMKADSAALNELVERVYDVQRRIITGRELFTYVEERFERFP